MPRTLESCISIQKYYNANGREKTEKHYGITWESIRRHIRTAKSADRNVCVTLQKPNAIVQRLLDRYTAQELDAIANGHSIQEQSKVKKIKFAGEKIRFGHITDTHVGSKDFYKEHLFSAFDEFERQKVQFICHTGDVTEGMSHRQGHVYELDKIGYDAQKKYAIELFKQAPCKVYAIDGNHDRWYIKSNGAIVVKDISDVLGSNKFEFLGHDEGRIHINGIEIRLFHGEDSSSYATSYRMQKLVEAMRGGDKPNILLVGHTHKTIFMPSERNIHCFSGGCLQVQTAWMRGKRIRADVGFWIIDAEIRDGGVSRIGGSFYPFY